MQAIILAGGFGRRLYAQGTQTPKPMLPLFDYPIIEHTVKLLAKHDIKDIIVCTSHEAQDLIRYMGDGRRFGVNIRYSVEGDALGSGGALKRMQRMLSDTFLLIHGDVITDCDISAALHMHRKASALVSVLSKDMDDPTNYGVIRREESGLMNSIVEKPKLSEALSNSVNTGVYLCEPEVLSSIPYNTVCDFVRDVFPRLLSNREPIFSFDIPGYWCDAGDMISYKNAHFDTLTGKLRLDLPAVHIGEGIWLGENVEIDSSVQVSAPMYIGEGVTLRPHCKIGKNTVIGPQTWVEENAKISESVIGCYSFVGRGSVISGSVNGGGHRVASGESIIEALKVDGSRYYTKPTAATPMTPERRQPTPTRVRQEAESANISHQI